MFIRRVSGKSMSPALEHGQIVLGWRHRPQAGAIVLARQNSREVIKRVRSVEAGSIYLVGDNSYDSKDSRHYGPVSNKDIIGSIMITFPNAINPPKLVKPYGEWFGRAAATVLVVMALIHLFRIDTFIPILDEVLPGGNGAAIFVAVSIILSEIFAVPFVLRMRLSLLANLMSGALVAFAPLWWLLIAIWAFGSDASIGQFGEFIDTPSGPLLLVVNLLWVGFNYATLWVLGFNNLPLKKLLKK